eukprot:Gb_01848 [translate_table: standard]
MDSSIHTRSTWYLSTKNGENFACSPKQGFLVIWKIPDLCRFLVPGVSKFAFYNASSNALSTSSSLYILPSLNSSSTKSLQVVDVASLSLSISSMVVYVPVGCLHVGHLVDGPPSVGLLFSLTVVDVG